MNHGALALAGITAAVAALGGAGGAAAQQQTAPPPLQWLAGCWESRRGDLVIEEQWLAPRGGVLVGASRTARRDSVTEYEFMRIYPRAGDLIFAAAPSGQAPAEFTATAVTAGEVVFENAAHDFPRRISYRHQPPDSLIAEISGELQGTTRRIAFRYARAACVPPPR
jgi:hypothetical protein